jgi:hypothetical protein
MVKSEKVVRKNKPVGTLRKKEKLTGHRIDIKEGGNLEPNSENERLSNLLISLLLSLGFNVMECREIYREIKNKMESGISIDIRNMMELINFTFSINQDLTTMREVPQIFDFDKNPIEILEEIGKKTTESERKEFVMKSYLAINFTKLKELMTLIGFSVQEQNWITTRLELIHNTNDGPICINEVISKIKSMIQTIGNDVRMSFIEIVSVYDHYESFG